MKLTIIQIGKTKSSAIQQLCQDYHLRTSRFAALERVEIPDVKRVKTLSKSELKKKEAVLFLEKIQPADHLVLLDEKGKLFTSEKWAVHLQAKMNLGPKRIVFVVGGAYGFDQKMYGRADEKLSLSPMTFSHQIIRAIFSEQLYRAISILNNQPYHNS